MATIKMKRKTKETDISLSLDLYGSGQTRISTGIGFFDHMLDLLAFHACFDLDVRAKGDLQVCCHHTVEDVGIVLGQAFEKGLAGEKNFRRYSTVFVPMDESLARAACDISGRPCLVFTVASLSPKVGEFDTELVREFFQAFVNHGLLTLHLEILYGENTHHKIEALFKATGQALRHAVETDPRRTGPASTKGRL
ncbi:MAG: imidazoleglycerol-phosphate dehydratase HisB [bacterium]